MQLQLIDIWNSTKKTILFVTHSVDEAVFLSDRILVLSPRPGKIHQIYEVNMPKPRDRTSIEFATLRKSVLAEIEKLQGENQNI